MPGLRPSSAVPPSRLLLEEVLRGTPGSLVPVLAESAARESALCLVGCLLGGTKAFEVYGMSEQTGSNLTEQQKEDHKRVDGDRRAASPTVSTAAGSRVAPSAMAMELARDIDFAIDVTEPMPVRLSRFYDLIAAHQIRLRVLTVHETVESLHASGWLKRKDAERIIATLPEVR